MARGFLNGSYDIGQLLDRKYNVMEQEANARTTGADAAMMGAQTDRMGMPSTIASREAATKGQTINNKFAPDILGAGLLSTRASTRLTNAQARGEESLDEMTPFGLAGRYLGLGLRPAPTQQPTSGLSFGGRVGGMAPPNLWDPYRLEE